MQNYLMISDEIDLASEINDSIAEQVKGKGID